MIAGKTAVPSSGIWGRKILLVGKFFGDQPARNMPRPKQQLFLERTYTPMPDGIFATHRQTEQRSREPIIFRRVVKKLLAPGRDGGTPRRESRFARICGRRMTTSMYLFARYESELPAMAG